MKTRIAWIVVIIIILLVAVFVLRKPQTTEVSSTNSTYVDNAKTFSFSYPKIFIATTTPDALVEVDIPRTYMPKTNFSEAKFAVLDSNNSVIVSTCLTATNGETLAGTVNINGVTFTKMTLGDAGAGNFYDVTSYRTVRNNTCYALESVIHSTNIGNYSPDQGITEFDKTQIQGILDTIAQSFKFL